ncbi:hypothetical protein FOG51_00429 [Hanseniaspora uvarum]|nr:hypothetical protein FOG51_00429 [Hanseniaspora uvarum]
MSNSSEYAFSKQNPPLFQEPDRWRAVWDDEYQRFYFVDLLNNNQSQWEPPAGTVATNAVQHQTYQEETVYSNANANGADQKGMFSSFNSSSSTTNTNTGSTSSKSHTGTILGAGAGIIGGLLLGNALKDHKGHDRHHRNDGPGFGGHNSGFGGHNSGRRGSGGHNSGFGGHNSGFGAFSGGPGGPFGGPGS